MSVVVQERSDSKVMLYSKGADSVIFSNLAHHSGLSVAAYQAADKPQETLAEVTQLHLDQYARVGLRTLCFAKRVRVCGG